VVGLVALALWLPRLRGPIDLRYDGGAYYILGTALAEGRGYRLLNEPGEIPAIQYPPLLPLLVAAHQKALGTGDPVVVGQWLRRSFLVLSLGYALATYALMRRFLPPPPALLATLFCSLAVYTYFLSDLCFAEIPFALVTTLFVLVARKHGALGTALQALLGAVAFLLRSLGLALLLAWVVESLLARRFRQAALRAALALLPVVLWQAHIQRVRSSSEYTAPRYAYQRAPYQYHNVSYSENALLVDPFRPELGRLSAVGLLERAFVNLAWCAPRLGEAVSAPQRFWEWSFFAVGQELRGGEIPTGRARAWVSVLGFLVIAGVVLLWASGERLIPVYILASLGLICLTPWPGQFTRYAAPLAPFLALALVSGFRTCSQRLAGRGPRGARLATFAAVVGGGVLLGVQLLALHYCFGKFHAQVSVADGHGRRVNGRLFFYDETWRAYETSLAWLADRAQTRAVVATSAPQLAHLRTGLKAVLPPLDPDTASAQRQLDSVPVRYLIVDDLDFSDMSRRYAHPVVSARPDLWSLIYEKARGGVRIYRRSE
jgi:hypothetical protein